ncbi:MAG: glycosyl transferase, family 2 [uncultured Solirubrobacteraceae bacterium]|uniref:Glycosyl transferase, family 2 n=1 Tax=uncultured Solirubrobacteraceae bacterium TaxID=1162706 RepID=A0A6J4SP66_9ACTN|nr:MAG: glycosyl transferase, family 2 [uncultured Solirubrobacteraceae bacterium]
MTLISVIIPAYNERDCVDELARRLAAVFDSLPAYDFEAIVVENGSLDDTYERLVAVRERDPRFKIVQLARNFRMDGGITAGLDYATGDAAVIMTADLQDPPELIAQFVAKWEEGYENIYGIVTDREGTGPIRTFNSKAFYWLAGKLTSDRIPRNASDFRLVDRRVYETVRGMEERNRFIRGLFAWSGFRSIGVPHKREPRFGGVSNAHSLKVIDLAMKGIFAHSYVPLKVISVFGAALSLLSFVVLVALSLRFLFFGVPFAGFGTIVGLILLLFGFLFTMLGIVSEYIGLIYEEVKQRPNYVVRETLGVDARQRHKPPLSL